MIETKIPSDIRKYKTKIVGTLTLRQLICILITVIVDVILYYTLLRSVSLSLRACVYLYMFIDIPIMMFIYEPQGIPMEKYIMTVLIQKYFAPTKRYAKDKVTKNTKPVDTKAIKKREKEVKKLLKKNPNMKAYK